ncbi:hypothetical protein GCK72_019027 [Caenorhabditis remanei]|uniref:Nose resistant-to-fluoxetine protein N-terminal domain-containing protein n=1 Tax=Caenorhabditis remanei TaxID=31234 RepID=A0A6A5GDD6_CAERE|nr:hypothetical protein GCK72_019027 [Caenorhabditis remanei]KAF1752472.1 hypothetical protein GCK72_019027 [Caenorhabditis remanei]
MKSLSVFATVSTECIVMNKCTPKELKILKENLYAIQQLDAFGQLPAPGLLELRSLYDGSYQDCNRISGKKYETNYCYLLIIPGKNKNCSSNSSTPSYSSLPVRYAACLPESCDHEQMKNIFNQISIYPFTACNAFCVKNKVEKDITFWGFSFFLMIISTTVILTSSVGYFRETIWGISSAEECYTFMKVLLTFSVWTNSEQILSVKEQKPGHIRSLDCIRFFSTCWVVTVHAFLYFYFADTLEPVLQFPKHFWNHLMLNAPTTWILFYTHRYLRLTPPIITFIWVFIVYGPYIQGVFEATYLNQISLQIKTCRNYWWRNLLFINNFDNSESGSSTACYNISWYLAVDMQLYLIAPIVLVAFYFSLSAGTSLILAGCVGSIITTYLLFEKYDIPADMIGNGDQKYFFDVVYSKPWVRCTPYLIGLLNGYLLAVYGNRKLRLNRIFCFCAWIIAFIIAGFCLFANYDYDRGVHWSIFSRASFYNFHRIGWAFFICWVVGANHMGWSGPINNFMSHPIWQPLGRLSYCAYIVHLVVLYYFLNVGGVLHYYSAWEVCRITIAMISRLEKMLIQFLIGENRTSTSESKRNLYPMRKKELKTPECDVGIEEESVDAVVKF